MVITILDYGVGNLHSVELAINRLGFKTTVSSDPAVIGNAHVLVIPGQGAFAQAVQNLKEKALFDLVIAHIQSKKPYLGICLGFQLLFERSEENGIHQGLGLFEGQIKLFPKLELKVPHMGWNQLQVTHDPNKLFDEFDHNPYVYFAHSYYLDTPEKEIVSTVTEYGMTFVSSIQTETIFATQFHPEKSGEVGLRVLQKFLDQHA
jgi:glutamine amidotransferase